MARRLAPLATPFAFLVALSMLGAACGPVGRSAATLERDALEPTGSAQSAPSPAQTLTTAGAAVFLPAPDRPVPRNPRALARDLVKTTLALRESVRSWLNRKSASWPSPPRAVALQALYQQRMYRTLAGDARLGRRTVGRLPGWLAGEARGNVGAGEDLFSLVRASHRRRVPVYTQRPEPAAVLLRYYRQAQRRFGVSWAVLASVNFIESKFGRVRSASPAGAQGPMQFIPSTWAAYGLGGHVHDPHDAIMGAANYLRASGAPRRYRRALYAYNPAGAYVDAVLRYARQMRRQPRDYFEYYNWQVFLITPKGDRQLTGPGS